LAEISVEALRRLARNFLVGRGGEAELEDTKRTMESDPQLAMEFLQEMQTALDEVAPAGFTPEQWTQIDGRIASLMAPMIKRGGLGIFGKLFGKIFKKKSPGETATRIKRKGAPPAEISKPAPSESPISLVSPEPLVPAESSMPEAGMEEMAPIAPSPASELASEAEPIRRETKPAHVSSALLSGKKFLLPILLGLGVILLGLLFYWKAPDFLSWVHSFKKAAPAPVQLVLPKPKPQPTATPNTGPPHRALPPPSQYEPLPSDLPPMTPQAAGKVQPIDGLDDKDSDGHRGLPLP
jgi:hypothetical protein